MIDSTVVWTCPFLADGLVLAVRGVPGCASLSMVSGWCQQQVKHAVLCAGICPWPSCQDDDEETVTWDVAPALLVNTRDLDVEFSAALTFSENKARMTSLPFVKYWHEERQWIMNIGGVIMEHSLPQQSNRLRSTRKVWYGVCRGTMAARNELGDVVLGSCSPCRPSLTPRAAHFFGSTI
eukprot:scaffold22543_cov15-Tisochrysis_lutea.AAC.1